MFAWSEEHEAIAAVVRRFVDEEIRPHLDDLEHHGVAPYDILRAMYRTFGLTDLARESFARQLARKVNDEPAPDRHESDPSATIISTIELCRVSPGLVTSLGVSTGLAAGTINKLGTPAQMERWGRDLMTLDTIGAWAITEPDSGSDALGACAPRPGATATSYVLNGQKTWITNGPYADTIVLYAKLDDGSGADPRRRPVLTFVLDAGMPGLDQAAPMRKMGQHASPTGDVFLADVRRGARPPARRERGAARRRAPEREGQLRRRARRRGGDVPGHHRGVRAALGRLREDTGASGGRRSATTS